MYLIDSHTHIFTKEFDLDRADMVQRAIEVGVQKLCLPNIDLETVDSLHSVCEAYPSQCYPMMGLHPTSVTRDYPAVLAKIKRFFSTGKYIAVGEIGIDLYWDKTFQQEQIAAFEEQLRWSMEWHLPVAIHSRNAFPEVFESLDRVGASCLRGVFHSFEGSYEELKKALTYTNFFLGINGIVTYKKALFRDYLPLAPVERILLETDAPYLTPVPHRGKRNEPAYLLFIAGKLAEIYGLSIETVIDKTTANAKSLFGI
jgi:TatD DNase family protein